MATVLFWVTASTAARVALPAPTNERIEVNRTAIPPAGALAAVTSTATGVICSTRRATVCV